MNKEKKQHKESIIGKIIYGFLMFSPLLAILFTSLYVVINPNAKDSYYGETINESETTIINNKDNLISGKVYILRNSFSSNNIGNIGTRTNLINYENIQVLNNTSEYDFSDTISVGFYQNPGSESIGYYFYKADNTYINISSSVTFEFKITYISNNLPTNNVLNNSNTLYFMTYNKYSYLDNVFYYGLDTVENSPYFTWSKDTAIYDVLSTTCNGIGITTTFIPFILTYWLIVSLIYLIYDLVLVFVHVAHNKIHELEEF